MRTRNIVRTITTAVAVSAALLLPTAAFAYAPAGADFVTCAPDPAAPGDTVACTGGLFDPATDVNVSVTCDDVAVLTSTETADADGEISFSYDVPEDGCAVLGISLSGTRDGEPSTVNSTVDVEAAEDDAVAETGSDSGILAVVAIGAIAVGGGALMLSRRQRTTTSA